MFVCAKEVGRKGGGSDGFAWPLSLMSGESSSAGAVGCLLLSSHQSALGLLSSSLTPHLSFVDPTPSAKTGLANSISLTVQYTQVKCSISLATSFHHSPYSLTYCQASDPIYYYMQECRLAYTSVYMDGKYKKNAWSADWNPRFAKQ